MAPGRGLGWGGHSDRDPRGDRDPRAEDSGVLYSPGHFLLVPLPLPLRLPGWVSPGRRSVLGANLGGLAQRCSLQVEGCRRGGGRGLSAGSGPCGLQGMVGSKVHLPVPGTLSLGFPGPEPEPEGSSCPSTPTPGTLASNARTFTPALHAAAKETEAQRAEGMAETTQHVLGGAPGQLSPALLREQLSGRAG